jgi:D-alanyl-lipoteichoic acid acyltransferase DltB (MBOAT superfamily)
MMTLGLEVLLACAAGLLLIHWLPRGGDPGRRLWPMIAISAAVVAYWQPRTLVATLALTAATWLALRLASTPSRRRLGVAFGVVALLAPLVYYKYAAWLLASWPWARGLAPLGREVPLGISFTVFRLIGVLMDTVNLRIAVSGGELLLLALFFPTLRSGPITTVQSFGTLDQDRLADRVVPAIGRIFLGLCRKLLLANNLSTLILTPWLRSGIAALTPEQCLLLPVLFGLRVYWDFAGYTDIAIGTASLFGYRVPENFDRPYLSRNLVEFWRRWHITLSEWIRLRLFMKLVGRRSGKARLYAATIVSMALCGLWHGAGWGFLLWGVWHGAGIVATHVFGDLQRQSEGVRRLAAAPGSDAVATAVTFTYVHLGWLLFFLPVDEAWLAAGSALAALSHASGWAWLGLMTAAGAVAYALAGSGPAWRERWAALPAAARGAAYGLLTWAMVVSAQPEPFLYFRF